MKIVCYINTCFTLEEFIELRNHLIEKMFSVSVYQIENLLVIKFEKDSYTFATYRKILKILEDYNVYNIKLQLFK